MLATMDNKPADASAAPCLPRPSGEGRGEGTGTTGRASVASPPTEPQSFVNLVLDHQEQITRLVHRLLGWRGEVEDVVQDVFVDALKNLARFRGHSSVETWLTRIAINRCRSHQRRAWVRRMLPLPVGEGRGEGAAKAEGGRRKTGNFAPSAPWEAGATCETAHSAEAQETIAEVHAAIRQLKQSDRELIVLRYLEEQSVDDIALALGLARGTVNVRLNRARSRLEKILKPLSEK